VSEAEGSGETPLRMAIVHPWINEIRGGEKVFFEIARTFPEADLFFLFGHLDRLPDDLRHRVKGTSFLQQLQWWRVSYRSTLPLLPLAAQSLNLTDYDVVISSSSGWAHGVRTRPDAAHICYMYSPPRYLWEDDAELPIVRAAPVQRIAHRMLHQLRKWDLTATKNVSHFIAISEIVRARILEYYGREAAMVNPSVEMDRFSELGRSPGNYVLAVGELVPYKRFDLAIQACRIAGLPLVIVGDGPDRRRLEHLNAGGDTKFLGRVSDETLNEYLRKAGVYIHGGIEDFGISAVEALAAGVPVVGLAVGGTAEIVGDFGVGVLAESADPVHLAAALTQCLADPPSSGRCRQRADAFRSAEFRRKIKLEVEKVLDSNGVKLEHSAL
jgi:glycosyltransferase involved in cell wall biosynthesis